MYSNDVMGNNNQINGILYADISDHLPIFVLTKRTSDLNDDIIIETRKQNESTIHTFRCLVDNICWQDVYACDDPDKSYRIFLEKIYLVYDEAFPIIKRKVRQSKCKPWITKGIKKIQLKQNINCIRNMLINQLSRMKSTIRSIKIN